MKGIERIVAELQLTVRGLLDTATDHEHTLGLIRQALAAHAEAINQIRCELESSPHREKGGA